MATIGTCSICGGRVSVPDVWMGTVPPIPTCEQCGAKKLNPHGPVIPMTPSPKMWQVMEQTQKLMSLKNTKSAKQNRPPTKIDVHGSDQCGSSTEQKQ